MGTLQTEGVISFSDLQTQLGGSNPISLSEYFIGAGYTGDCSTSVPIVGTGNISLSHFYGATN